MILAADVGGSKTLVGLFEPHLPRPRLVDVRSVRTLDFAGLPPLLSAYLDGHPGVRLTRVGLGVAGPVVNGEAAMTNVPWRVRHDDVAAVTGVNDVRLLNDLVAMAHCVPVLTDDERHVLRAGRPDPRGNAALIAAGTGIGEATLHRVGDRLLPVPAEAGHTDFAVRTDDEMRLWQRLRSRHGRVDVEHVVSGPGLVHIAEYTHDAAQCAVAGAFTTAPDGAASISASGAAGECPHCRKALDMFVDAYGAEAGNLALRAVATAGIFVGGGIAPKMLDALQGEAFLGPFTAKPPMTAMLADIPVHIILNAQAGLVGAAVAAASAGISG